MGLRCEQCHRDFESDSTRGPRPRYCSGACRQAAFRARHRPEPATVLLGQLRASVPGVIHQMIEEIDDLESLRWFHTFHNDIAVHCLARIDQLEAAQAEA